MSSFDRAEALLGGIECELQERIDLLLEVNENYRDILHVLEQIEPNNDAVELEEDLLLPIPPSCSVEDKSSKGVEQKKEDDVMAGVGVVDSTLDDILLKAKAIREKNPPVIRNKGSEGRKSKSAEAKSATNRKEVKSNDKKSSSLKVSTKHEQKSSSRQSVIKSSFETETSLPLPPDRGTESKATAASGRVIRSSDYDSQAKQSSHSPILPLYEAVDSFLCMKLQQPLDYLLPSKTLYLNQTQFLSRMQSRPSFPPSSLLNVFAKHFEQFKPLNHQPVDISVEKCVKYLKRTRIKFEKMLQLKINRLATSSVLHTLNDGEVLEICVMWWNLHRCIVAYENCLMVPIEEVDCRVFTTTEGEHGSEQVFNDNYGSIKNNAITTERDSSSSTHSTKNVDTQEEQDFIRLRSLCSDLISSLPLCSPPLPSAIQGTHSCPPNLPVTLAYHDQVQTRVNYTVETILSKLMLRPVLQAMKECVAATSAANGVASSKTDSETKRPPSGVSRERITTLSGTSGVDEQWKVALQLFQAAHQMLAHEGLNGDRETDKQRNKKMLFFKKDIRML